MYMHERQRTREKRAQSHEQGKRIIPERLHGMKKGWELLGTSYTSFLQV